MLFISAPNFKKIQTQAMQAWQQYEKKYHLDEYKKKKFAVLSKNITKDQNGQLKISPFTVQDLKNMPTREEREKYEQTKNNFLISYYLQFFTYEELLPIINNASIEIKPCDAIDKQCSKT